MKKSTHKRLAPWDKYSKFAADFETTKHKEFSDEQILWENRSSFAVQEQQVDFTPNDSSKVFLAGLMSLKDYSYKLSFEDIADFINNIAEMTYKEHHNKALVWFHNLGYDGSYLLNWLLQHNYKQTSRTNKYGQEDIHRKEFAMLSCGGKFFNLTFWWRGIKIKFLDSLKLFPSSLASLGETIGYKKLKELVDYSKFEIDKNHNYPKEWLIYLQRDCEILAHILNEFFNKEPLAKTLKRQTIGSVAYAYIKSIIKEKIPNFTIADYQKFEPWYHGGLTFPSMKYWAKWVVSKQNIKMIDACSMYPSNMIKDLPFGEPRSIPDKNWTKYCCFMKVHIKSAVIKKKYSDIAIIPKPYTYENGKKIFFLLDTINKNYQYVQEVYDKEYYFIDNEFNIIKELYDIDYKIIETHYFQMEPYLKDIVQKLFIDKQKASREHKPVEKLLAKLRLNSIYGKTGQKPIRQQDFYGSIDMIDTNTYKIIGKKNTLVEAYNIEKIKKDTEKANPIFLAAYITASARVCLITKYLEIVKQGGKFLYSDTDSIAYVDNPKKNCKFNDIGDNLGQWEYEEFKYYHKVDGQWEIKAKTNKADGFCSLCPKQYRIVLFNEPVPCKFASAGVKKELMFDVKNQDYNYDLGDNKKYKLIKTQLKNSINGKVIWDSPFNFKKWKSIKTNPKCPKELEN